MSDVNFSPAVMNGCDQPGIVPSDIENSEFTDFIRVRKNRADLLDVRKSPSLHLLEPLGKTGRAARVQLGELVEPFARDNVHQESAKNT